MARPMASVRKNATLKVVAAAARKEAILAGKEWADLMVAWQYHEKARNTAMEQEMRRRYEAMAPLVESLYALAAHLERLSK